MNRRGFLRSMLCTAAAAVAPVPAMSAGLRTFVGVDPGFGPDSTVMVHTAAFTLAEFRAAVATLRSQAVPGPYVLFVHPDNMLQLKEELDDMPDYIQEVGSDACC